MPQLDPQFYISQVFWLILVFALVYMFVTRYFLPRIGNVVELRAAQIKDDLAYSEVVVRQYKKMESEANVALEKARRQAFEHLDAASKNAAAQVAERMSYIENDISSKTAKQEERLARLRSQMRSDISKLALELKRDILAEIVDQFQLKGMKSN